MQLSNSYRNIPKTILTLAAGAIFQNLCDYHTRLHAMVSLTLTGISPMYLFFLMTRTLEVSCITRKLGSERAANGRKRSPGPIWVSSIPKRWSQHV